MQIQYNNFSSDLFTLNLRNLYDDVPISELCEYFKSNNTSKIYLIIKNSPIIGIKL